MGRKAGEIANALLDGVALHALRLPEIMLDRERRLAAGPTVGHRPQRDSGRRHRVVQNPDALGGTSDRKTAVSTAVFLMQTR